MAIQTIKKKGIPVAFQAQVRVKGAKSASATFPTFEEAEEFERATKKAIMAARSVEETRRTYSRDMKPVGVAALAAMGVAQVADEFAAANPEHCYAPYAKKIKELVADARVAELDRDWTKAFCERMRKAKAWRRDNCMAEGTIAQYLGMIRRMCNWKAESLGVAKPRLGLTTDFLEPGWDDGRERRLRGDEEQRIRGELGLIGAKRLWAKKHSRGARGKPWPVARHYQLIFDFAIETCARQMEMVSLPWREVDLERRIWTLPAKRSKTRRKRKIYLTARALEILQELWLDRNPRSPLVFHRLPQNHGFSCRFADVVDRLGIDDLVFHDLRHEGISRHRLNKTFEPEVLMKMVGHSSPRMTMRYFNPEDEEVIAHMEAAMERKRAAGEKRLPPEVLDILDALLDRRDIEASLRSSDACGRAGKQRSDSLGHEHAPAKARPRGQPLRL